MTRSQLRWGEHQGHWRHIGETVYRHGPENPSPLDRAIAVVIRTGGVACGCLAGVLHHLDSVELVRGIPVALVSGKSRGPVSRAAIEPDEVMEVQGFPCTTGTRTLVDLAGVLTDDYWEHALESALRQRLTTVDAVEAATVRRARGSARIRRVLAKRPAGAAPTESLLETLMVQVARLVPGLAPPTRQLVINDEHGVFVARVDLSWPELGIFLELDGQQHKGQPVYDAARQTAVVAATGWLVGRFTWDEVRRNPRTTARRLADLVARAQGRRLAA